MIKSDDNVVQSDNAKNQLPGSNSEQLMNSIKQHLMTLPPDTVVHSGHGLETTIGNEIQFNPFLKSL